MSKRTKSLLTAPCDPPSKQSRALCCTLVLAPDRPEFCRAQEKEAFEASSEFGGSFIPGIRCNRLDRHSRCLLQLFCSEGKTAFFQVFLETNSHRTSENPASLAPRQSKTKLFTYVVKVAINLPGMIVDEICDLHCAPVRMTRDMGYSLRNAIKEMTYTVQHSNYRMLINHRTSPMTASYF